MANKNKRCNHRNKNRDTKRSALNYLMSSGLKPEPLKGGWIKYICPFCEEQAIYQCDVSEYYCSSCNEVKSFQYLVLKIEEKTGRLSSA